VTETDRVNRAAQAIADSDWPLVGQLMNESGRSSAHNYEISHPSVEQIVAICQDHPGVLGARMMGGGQGGSALVLAQDAAVTSLLDRLDSEYFSLSGTDAPAVRTLPCAISAGAGLVIDPQAS
jgi:galactokinase